jgi:hypothetical protein
LSDIMNRLGHSTVGLRRITSAAADHDVEIAATQSKLAEGQS